MATKQILNSSTAPDGSQYVTLTDGAGNLVTAGGASGITIGTTTITGGADTQVLFNNAGVVSSDAGLTKVSGATGAVTLGGVLALPDTASSTVGVINLGGARFLHDQNAISNVFLGHNVANFTTTATNTVAIGESAMLGSVSGANNTAIGRFAMGGAVTGGSNTAIGSAAMGGLTSGSANVTVGNGANGTVSGTNTTVVGSGACAAATGASTTGIGFQALILSTGSNNTGVGASTAPNLTTGTGNVFIGAATGGGIQSGANNTIVGAAVTGLASAAAGVVVLAGGAAGANRLDFGVTNAVTWTFTGPLRPQTYTVATLPAAPGAGAIAVITDQLTTAAAKGVAPTGGGAVTCAVIFTGAAWVGI